MYELGHVLLRVVGPAMFMAMQISSLNTARQVWINQEAGKLSIFPHLSMWSNSFLWTLYGLLRADFTVLIPNFTGALTGLVCTYVHHKYSSDAQLEKDSVYFIGAGCVSLYGIVCAFFGASGAIGSLAVIMCVILMGSPLVVIQTVLQDGNCSSMPFWTSLTIWLNTLAWSLYGLVDAHDFNIYFPNLCGLFLGSIQMVLFLVYGLPPGTCNSNLLLPTSVSAGGGHRVTRSTSASFVDVPSGPVVSVRTVYTPLNGDGSGGPATTYSQLK